MLKDIWATFWMQFGLLDEHLLINLVCVCVYWKTYKNKEPI